MKILFITALAFITLKSDAQIIVNNDINKFVGIWRWSSGNDTVEITLQKQNYHNQFQTLCGWHKYVKNGILIESSYQYIGRDINVDFSSNDADFKTTLNGSCYPSTPNNIFFTRFWDLSLHKNFNLFLNMLPGSTTQATWKLRQPRGVYVGPPGKNGLFTLPRDLIMTKL